MKLRSGKVVYCAESPALSSNQRIAITDYHRIKNHVKGPIMRIKGLIQTKKNLRYLLKFWKHEEEFAEQRLHWLTTKLEESEKEFEIAVNNIYALMLVIE